MTHSIDSLIVEVRRQWDELGAELLTPASPTDLADFEERFKVKLPDDFASYLTALGGMSPGTTDEHDFRFWPLAEIKPDPASKDPAPESNFVFADFLIYSIEYAINLSPAAYATIFRLDGPSPTKIASSFTEFLALYVPNPLNLLGKLKPTGE